MRTRHYSRRSEAAYLGRIRRFILFHGKRHPDTRGEPEAEAFLTHLATQAHVSASTQNQALAALLLLYRDVLSRELGWLQTSFTPSAQPPARRPQPAGGHGRALRDGGPGEVKYVWTLSWFDRMTDALAGEQTFEALSDPVVAEILGVPVDELLTGEWPVDAERAHRLEVAAGHKPDVTKYDYFLGAETV